jgi:hypothetical protein
MAFRSLGALVIAFVTFQASQPTPLRAQRRSPAPRTGQTAWSSAQWRDWFLQRRFALDPWFFFGHEESGMSGCPEDVRLSLGVIDSVHVQFHQVDDRAPPPTVRTSCRVSFVDLRLSPARGVLGDGRRMWRLHARMEPKPRAGTQ